MKRSLLFVFFVITQITGAQTKLTGTIKSKDKGEPLPGAIVYFPDLKNGTVAKTDGTFEINNLPAFKILMQVKYIGYKTIIKTIDPVLSPTLDILLEESV